MADNDQAQIQQPVQVVVADVQTALAQEQKAIAEAARKAELEQKDESKFPGGRYLLANGTYVNAEGKPHKDQKSE